MNCFLCVYVLIAHCRRVLDSESRSIALCTLLLFRLAKYKGGTWWIVLAGLVTAWQCYTYPLECNISSYVQSNAQHYELNACSRVGYNRFPVCLLNVYDK